MVHEKSAMNFLLRILSVTVLISIVSTGFRVFRASHSASGPLPSPKIVPDSIVHAELIFCGDIMQHMPQITSAWDDSLKKYNYAPCFRWVKPFISSADFALTNFETNLDSMPYAGYPQFSCPDELAYELKRTGYDLILMANNHCCDRSQHGLERSIRVMKGTGMACQGTYLDSADYRERNVQLLTVNGIRLVFLNYTYSTNGIPPIRPNIVSFIDTGQIRHEIYKARLQQPDMIIPVFHWGIEYDRQQSTAQAKMAAFCFDLGASLVLGSHPHVVQPALEFTDSGQEKKVVFYSVGNYVSNQRDRFKNGGIMAVIRVTKNLNSGKTFISDWGYIPIWVYKQAFPIRYEIIPVWNFLQDTALIQRIPVGERETMKLFYSDTKQWLGEKHEIQKKVSFE